jgi:hypothetical protein
MIACDDDPSYEANLRDFAEGLRVVVDVLGTPDPPTVRRLRVLLDPGPGATIDQDSLCPVIHAKATVNGTPLQQTGFGEYFFSGGGSILSGSSGCEPITFELDLAAQADSHTLWEEPTRIDVTDGSGAIHFEGRAVLVAPRISFAASEDALMIPGSTVQLRVEPDVLVLPRQLEGYYRAAEEPGRSFGLGQITKTAEGIAFFVLATAAPSSGAIEIQGDGSGNAFRGLVDRCEGAAFCRAERSVCAFDSSCSTGIAYGSGFDRFVLPASVALP